jgi:PKD repeat protein
MKNRKQLMILSIAALFLLVNFSGFTIGFEEKQTISSKGTHTVLAEVGAASTCPYCPSHEYWIEQVVGDYFVVGLPCSHYSPSYGFNADIIQRLNELNMGSYPASYWDGGYTSVSGGQSSSNTLQNAYNACASRTVKDVDIDLSVYWLGGAEMELHIDVSNNEASSYPGHLRVYILEIESRWMNYNNQPYHNALLSMAYDDDITVGSTSTWTHSFNWDGDDHGYGDITSDNILVVASVFSQSTDLTDETAGTYPLVQVPPTALFSFTPDSVEIGEDLFFNDESYDPDGYIVSWSWDFGDGNISSEEDPVHSYTQIGSYQVSLTVVDDDGLSDSYSSEVIVTNTGEDLGVNQNLFDLGFRLRPGWNAAQEFVTQFATLSRVELFMTRFASPSGDVTVEICDDSTSGTVVYEGVVSPSDVPAFPTYAWVSIDIGDVSVDPDETYVIVLKDAVGATEWDCLLWGFHRTAPFGSGGPYTDGWFWFQKKFQPYWFPATDWDYTFRTYGYD